MVYIVGIQGIQIRGPCQGTIGPNLETCFSVVVVVLLQLGGFRVYCHENDRGRIQTRHPLAPGTAQP